MAHWPKFILLAIMAPALAAHRSKITSLLVKFEDHVNIINEQAETIAEQAEAIAECKRNSESLNQTAEALRARLDQAEQASNQSTGV